MPTPTLTETGACVVCNARVEVTFRRDGGLPVTANDYSGLTDDGDDFVCPDHHCTVCGGSHRDAAQFDACAYNGPQRVDLDPPCSVDAAYAILGAQGLLR